MRAKSNESESIIKSSATEIVFTESTKIARMQISKDVLLLMLFFIRIISPDSHFLKTIGDIFGYFSVMTKTLQFD